MPEERAINPYNFIPFGIEPKRKSLAQYYCEPLESGWIDVQLLVKTPLIIPDASHPRTDTVMATQRGRTVPRKHNSYDFYHLPNGDKVIPGSSLRGMIRSVYEAASNSCLPFVQEKPITIRGVTYSSYKDRGLLKYDPEHGCWELYAADVCSYKTDKTEVKNGVFRGFDNAACVRFSGTGRKLDPDSLEASQSEGSDVEADDGKSEGILHFNIPVTNNQYSVAVLRQKETKPLLRWNPNDNTSDVDDQRSPYQMLYAGIYDTLRNIRSDQEKRKSRNMDTPGADRPMEALREALESAAKNGGMVPCYYKEIVRGAQKLYYLSPASIGRVRQRRSWSEIMGAYSPCTALDADEAAEESHQKGVCPACALFGTVTAKRHPDLTGDNVESIGASGRIRFTDAHAKGPVRTQPYTLPILAEPKPCAFDFYLRKPNDSADFWNYDYYGKKKTDNNGADYYDLEKATPRGRKMYWHSSPKTEELNKLERPDLCNTMEAAEPKSVFAFRIYFDRITARQRQDLLWVLELGDNREDSPLQHKLGHAKPYGYGSVKLTVTSCYRRDIELGEKRAIHLTPLPLEPESVSFDQNSVAIRSLLQMCDTRVTEELRVEYPLGKKGKISEWTIYNWFAHNRTNPRHTLVLPEPTELREWLSIPTMRTTPDTNYKRMILTQQKLDEELLVERQMSEAIDAIERAKLLYPVGREIAVSIQSVISKQNHARLFAKLDDVPYQVTAEYIPGKKRRYTQGQQIRLRITGMGKNKDGYPNFVAEIVS